MVASGCYLEGERSRSGGRDDAVPAPVADCCPCPCLCRCPWRRRAADVPVTP